MSKHTTFALPRELGQRPARPARRPRGRRAPSAPRARAALAASISPPEDCITAGSHEPRGVGLRAEAAQVGAQQRGQRRIHLGGRRALVLAERPHQLVGERHVRRR